MSFGVKRIGLFGSSVRGEAKIHSDLDFIVEFFPTKKSVDSYFDLKFYLQDLFGKEIDLVTKEGLSKYIGPFILNEAEYVTFGN